MKPTVSNLQKKAEFTNILFNIMNERRAKRGYKCLKGIAAFWEGYEQHGRQYGVKRDGKKNGKGVDKSLRGRYNSKAVGRERQASETEVRAEGCERK